MRSVNGQPDAMTVEASTDAGATWTLVEVIESGVAWETHRFRLSEFPAPGGGAFRVRFTIADEPNDSLTEAAVDEFRVTALQCDVLRGDANGDGRVDLLDLTPLAVCLSGPSALIPGEPCRGSDLNLDNRVDIMDFGVLQRWFGSP